MVHEIAELVDRVGLVVVLRGDDDLRRLLADLFEDLVASLGEEVGGVRPLLRRLLAASEHLEEILVLEARLRLACEHRLEEAALRARVTGGAVLAHLDDEGVCVAVRRDGHDVLHVPARLALAPEFLPRAAEKARAPLVHRNAQALGVHIRQRQNLLRLGIHHDRGDQTVLIIFQIFNIQHLCYLAVI